jgi:hypothetical protein
MDLAGGAAALIRQQARDIDELWGRLSRAYLAVLREIRVTSFGENRDDSREASKRSTMKTEQDCDNRWRAPSAL